MSVPIGPRADLGAKSGVTGVAPARAKCPAFIGI
jgi:hypothetical protein